MTINKKEIAEKLNIGLKTFYNWEKNRPKLFEFIVNCYKKNISNVNNTSITEWEMELIQNLRELNKEERELYFHEIKARALRRKLG